MDNFTAIRNGLLKHIQEGRLCPFDLGVYVYLHLRADWSTGIFQGCALGIAHGFNDASLKQHINKSLIRLRDRQYINYPKGDGRRGGYEVLIHKYHVTVGELSGHRLNAWKHGQLCKPEYERWNGSGTVEAESRKSGVRVEEPYQDLLDIQDIKQDLKTGARSNFVAPTFEQVAAYCAERKNSVNPQRWMDHYLSNGWMVGRTRMKDWKAAIRKWEDGNGSNNRNGNRAEQGQQTRLAARDGAREILARRMGQRSNDDLGRSVSGNVDSADASGVCGSPNRPEQDATATGH